METVFISKLKPFLEEISKKSDLYIPVKKAEHWTFNRYNPDEIDEVEFNSIRTCLPVKEFLFPPRELAAAFPEPLEAKQIKPFAVFGLKECDLHSIEILDKVFYEGEFQDPFYIARREKMFIISGDCTQAGQSCFCNLFRGKGFADLGFDLNVSKIKDGFIITEGSQKGKRFIDDNPDLFADAPDTLLAQRDENRARVKKELEEKNADLKFTSKISEIIQGSQDSDVFDIEAQNCIECQACTRVCPTCHCFYLYDTKKPDYFAKMKMWDSCMRMAYAGVAGGANPRKVLGDRIKHRLLHKFVYFLERYGIDMCVGCGRCVDADAGGMDIREVLKKLDEEKKQKKTNQAEITK